jgi:hypothetical protein
MWKTFIHEQNPSKHKVRPSSSLDPLNVFQSLAIENLNLKHFEFSPFHLKYIASKKKVRFHPLGRNNTATLS